MGPTRELCLAAARIRNPMAAATTTAQRSGYTANGPELVGAESVPESARAGGGAPEDHERRRASGKEGGEGTQKEKEGVWRTHSNDHMEKVHDMIAGLQNL